MLWTDTFLDNMRQKGDPPADEAVEKLVSREGKKSTRHLFDKLIRHIELPLNDLPSVLQDFVSEQRKLPRWADQQQSRLAHDLFVDHGPKLMLLLFFKSLPLLYTDRKGAKVLAHTSRLVHDPESMESFSRRIAETGQFLLYVMRQETFTPQHVNVNIILKVRLIHAAIRHFIRQGEWDQVSLGQPINQEDMALTLMTFSIALSDGLSELGIHEQRYRLSAYQHHWNVIGFVLGVDERLLPQDLQSAQFLLQKILQRQSAPSVEGKLLTRALLSFSEKAIPGERLDVSAASLIRYFLGKEKSAMLGLAKKRGCLGWFLPVLMRLGFATAEKWEEHSEFIHYRADQLSKVMMQAMVSYFLSYKDRPFEVPEEFNRIWSVQNN